MSTEPFTPTQFRHGLKQLSLSLDDFAFFFGVNRRTAQRWATGQQEIALWVPVALALMTLPGGVEMANRVAQRLSLE